MSTGEEADRGGGEAYGAGVGVDTFKVRSGHGCGKGERLRELCPKRLREHVKIKGIVLCLGFF